jgi:hypothetical protein
LLGVSTRKNEIRLSSSKSMVRLCSLSTITDANCSPTSGRSMASARSMLAAAAIPLAFRCVAVFEEACI